MALNVSQNLKRLLNQTNKEPVLILEIEGSNYLYGTGKILELAKWDDPRIDWDNEEGITWDGFIERDDSRPYIDPKKSAKSISQQLLIDKGGSGSVSNMKFSLIDYNKEVAKDISFDNMGEILGKRANVYFTVKGGIFPQDAIELFRGYVLDTTYRAGRIEIDITNPANKLRSPIFEQIVSELTSDIDSVTTTIPVRSTTGFLETSDALTSYIRIDDELMEVISKTDTSYEVIRSRLNTLPVSHEEETETRSFYRLEGSSIDLALKLLHSNEDNTFKTLDKKIKTLNQISNVETIEGAIIVEDFDIQRRLGLVNGDFIEISGSTSNDGVYKYTGSGRLETGNSYLLVDAPLSVETGLNLPLKVKSKYNVLPEGIGLDVDQINTIQYEEVQNIFGSGFIDSDFYIKETIDNGKEFIDLQIMRPQGLYSLPNVRLGCKFTAPPFSAESIPILNTKNLVGMSKIIQKRSTHRYLKNIAIYRYNEDRLEDKFLDKEILASADSFNRITVGKKPDIIEAKGFRRSPTYRQVVQRISGKIIDRYKFAARQILNIQPLFSLGAQIELGDIVLFGGEESQLTNLQTGERDLPIEQYEVINYSKDFNSGIVKLTLLQTGFSLEGIVGVFSPSSKVDLNSTTSKILLARLWDTSQTTEEREKWEEYIGLKIRVRSGDYIRDENTTISGLDPNTNNGLLLEPALSFTPQEGDVIELAKYEEYGEEDLERAAKLRYTFTMPSALITGVTDSQNFDVDPADIGKFKVGMEVASHSLDYITDSSRAYIDNITLNTITLNEPFDITPAIGDRLEVYLYGEGEKGYRFL
jgi:hypothetical protein